MRDISKAGSDLEDVFSYTLQTWGESQLVQYKALVNGSFGIMGSTVYGITKSWAVGFPLGGLRPGLKFIGSLPKISPRLTHPRKYNIFLSPQIR